MTDSADAPHREYSRVLMRCLRNFYALHAPLEMVEMTSRRHVAIWEDLLSGREASEAVEAFYNAVRPLGDVRALVEQANLEAVWALTPVIAATLACGSGTHAVCLHSIREALTELCGAIELSQEAKIANAA